MLSKLYSILRAMTATVLAAFGFTTLLADPVLAVIARLADLSARFRDDFARFPSRPPVGRPPAERRRAMSSESSRAQVSV